MPAKIPAALGTWGVLLMAAAPLISGCRATGRARSEDLPAMIHQAQEQVFPALVFIKPIRQYLGTGERVLQQVFGSGVIISPDGLVVTNSHVATETTEIKCVLFSGEMFPARLIGLDEDTDLALIQVQLPAGHAPLPTAEFTDSDAVQPGQFVMALGSPFGFSRSISLGIISCARRYLDVTPYSLWIQTDAAINPGNSGGPLVDDHGRIVGITTLRVARGENIGFAVPANTVKRIAEELRAKGRVERSYSGIQFQPLKDFIREVVLDYDHGVLVGGVDERSPAAAAGLKAGDLVMSLNGQELRGTYLEDIPEARNLFASLPPGAPAEMSVKRGGETLQLRLSPVKKETLPREGMELEMWNCSVQEISKFRTAALAYFAPSGVYVLGVRRPGNAYACGLRAGDIILSVDREPIATPENMRDTYRRLSRLPEGRRTALLEVLRGGYRTFIALDFNQDYKRRGD